MDLNSVIGALAGRSDGWQNVILGLGGAKDPSIYTSYSPRAGLTEDVLEALYIEDHFAAKIVEALPRHGLRAGWDLLVPGDPEKAATVRDWHAGREEELDVAGELALGAVWGRVFGGAVTWIGADDGRESSLPLDEASIGGVRFLHTFDRRDVQIWKYYSDPRHPRFRQPEVYMLRPLVPIGPGGGGPTAELAAGVLVHESRCIRWGGIRSTDRRRQHLQGWDDSVIERCWDALKQLAEDYGAKSLLLGRISQAVYKIKGFYDMIAGKREDVLRRRMTLLDQSRSRARGILLDTDESYEQHSQPLSGVPETLQASVLRLASAADMPATVLMGQSPAGMDATGESDLEIWDANVDAWRTLELRPRHERIARILLLSRDAPTGGVEPEGWSIAYRPLRVPSEKERAETAKLYAEADAMNIEKGVYSAEAAAFRYSERGVARVILDEQELKERQQRRRELAKQPPKDNAELGTIAPRNQAVLDVIGAASAKTISRESALAILTKLHRFTEADAEALLGPETFTPAPAPPDPTPGPEPAPQPGQGAGAPQPPG